MPFQKKILPLALTAVLAVGLSGCNDDDNNTSSTPTTNTSTATDPYLVSDWYTGAGNNNRSGLASGVDSKGLPTVSSPTLSGATYAFTAPTADFVNTDYVGAYDPNAATPNWTDGWTVNLNGNATVWEPATGGTLAGGTPAADGACPTGTTDIGDWTIPATNPAGSAITSGSMDVCELPATISANLTLTNDNIYELAAGFPGTKVGNGDTNDGDTTNDSNVTLTIEPGTLIIGEAQEALAITRGSDVVVNGTAADPVVMTSKTQAGSWLNGGAGDGTAGRGEWAGFALMGYASTNECGAPCDVAAEGNIGYYGGANDADSSGTISYLVVRHAGNDIDGNGNELNGFTLFGTGSGTSIDHVQVHKGLDDGIEHFGSTDFMSYIVLTDNGDDSFDWGQGYRGGAQFMVIKQASDKADRAIEADNDGTNNYATPISQPTLANLTFMGDPNGDTGADGILLRRGTGAKIYNAIVEGFADNCVDLDDAGTFDRAGDPTNGWTGNVMMENSLVNCTTNFKEE